MTQVQIYKAMVAKAATLNADELKAEVARLMDDHSEFAGILIDVVLTALEPKIPTAEYVEFCNAL